MLALVKEKTALLCSQARLAGHLALCRNALLTLL